jgi:hypothetical protein
MLGVYTPGTTFEAYGPDSAKLLRGGKNMYLNFNIHYQTTGKPEKDASTLGFWFQSDPPKHQLLRVPASGETILAGGKELLTDASGPKAEGTSVAIPPIPAYAENYELVGITAYREPVTIYQFQPHAHLRGKDFRYAVVYPDGREESVLNVSHYDFHWQLAYELETPAANWWSPPTMTIRRRMSTCSTGEDTPMLILRILLARKRKCTFARKIRAGMKCSRRSSSTPSTTRT